jgi:2-polyprenyl-3-methyl-5-hydroxy-6-metoxy-1,4-benzoquinol methylase
MKLFHQENVPINQNLLYSTVEEARNAKIGELDIHYDENTGLIYNRAFNVNLINYSEEYNNDQHYSSFFSTYIDELIEWLITKYIYNASTLVEIGCGKGYFVKKIAERLSSCEVFGFDTSYVQNVEENLPNLHIFNEYYDSKKHLYPDTVICRHVIEHIHNPVDFLLEIKASMPENALLFLETPDVNWILNNDVIFDFFYEHCSYWNMSSLEYALCISGFEIVETKQTFSGQYMWIVSRAVNKKMIKNMQNLNEDILALCRKFISNREEKINETSNAIQTLAKKEKKLFIWGAGAKGVTFANLFDQKQRYVSAFIDINPSKQNKYIGITAHEVISPERMINIYIGNESGIIILNKNYYNEIEKYLISLGIYDKTRLYIIT